MNVASQALKCCCSLRARVTALEEVAAPSLASTYITQTPSAELTNEQALSALATGILKSTTITGVLSIAAPGTDYLAVNGDGSSLTNLNASNLSSGTVPVGRLSFTKAQLDTAISDGNAAYLNQANAFSTSQSISLPGINATTITTATVFNLGLLLSSTDPSNTTGHIYTGIALGEGYAGLYSIDAGGTAATALGFYSGNSSAVAEAMRIDALRNVLIGTTSPTLASKLQVESTAGAQIGGAYDSSNHWTATTNSVGKTSFTATGSGGGFVFPSNGAASTPALSLTGTPFAGTGTTSFPLFFFNPATSPPTAATTWSTAGTFLGGNLISGYTGNIFDFKANGASTSVFKVTGAGGVQGNSFGQANSTMTMAIGTDISFVSTAASVMGVEPAGDLRMRSGFDLRWASDATNYYAGSVDTTLARLGAANLRLGAAPSATPIAQTLTVGEASRPGTDNNVGGANAIHQSGLGTGIGTASSWIVQTPTVAASGTTVQTYVTRLTINATGAAVVGDLSITGSATLGSIGFLSTANSIHWPGRGYIGTTGNGIFTLFNEATTAGASFDVATDAVLKVRNRAANADAALTAAAITSSAAYTSGAPTTGSAGAIKFGQKISATLLTPGNDYWRVQIDGVDYAVQLTAITTP